MILVERGSRTLQSAFATSVIETTDKDRWLELGNGFNLFMNAAQSDTASQSGDDDIRAGAAVRYLPSGVAGFRPLIEVGGWTEPNAAFRFQRQYANGSGIALGEGLGACQTVMRVLA